MQLIVIATLALVAAAAAAPASPPAPPAPVGPGAPSGQKEVKILRQGFEPQPDGSYNFNFETEDGSQRDETGSLNTVNDEENKPHPVVTVRGSYSFVDPDGKSHSFTYSADETGFHVEGEDVPKVQQ